jgi:hypothetical protein
MTAQEIENALRGGGVKLPPDPDPLTSRAPLDILPGMPMENTWADITLYNFFIEGAEADVIATNSRTGVIEEYEIKVSRSDLLRECIIAQAAGSDQKEKLRRDDQAKFRKHQRFYSKQANYPTYYSFAVPEELVALALDKAPSYAGIVSVRATARSWYFAIDRVREPSCISRGKGDCAFFAEVAKHLSSEYNSIRYLARTVRATDANNEREFLKNLAKALIEVESELKKQGHWTKDAVEFLVGRAVSGMPQYHKECVQRYFLSSDFRELDLFQA